MNALCLRTGFFHLLILWAALVLLAPAPSAAFTTGEEGYPLPELGTDQVRKEGVVDRIDLEGNELVVDDELYTLLPTTEVYTHVMGFGSVHLVHEGRPVGFITNPKGEILILWLRE